MPEDLAMTEEKRPLLLRLDLVAKKIILEADCLAARRTGLPDVGPICD